MPPDIGVLIYFINSASPARLTVSAINLAGLMKRRQSL